MLAGIPLNVSTQATFAINTTYDFTTNGTRSGIVIGVPIGQYPRLIEASIAHNLTLDISQGFANQTLKIKAFNDFSAFDFEAQLLDVEPNPPPPPPPPPEDDN